MADDLQPALKFYLTGGGSNADRLKSIGGAISSVEIALPDNTLFDEFDFENTAIGYTDYRCIAIKNTHATKTYQGSKVYRKMDTISTTTEIQIGLDPTGVGAVSKRAASPASRTTAPAGVVFGDHDSIATSLPIGSIPAGQIAFIWIKYITDPNTKAIDVDTSRLQFRGGSSE